jgi:hypothetical protein
MVFVESRIATLDIFALAFGLFAIAAFVHGFREAPAASDVRACGPRFQSLGRLQMEPNSWERNAGFLTITPRPRLPATLT